TGSQPGQAAATRFGDHADNALLGTQGDDKIDGRGGDDTITGGRGDDWLLGDRGDDHLRGGDGRDTISGGRGDDVIVGGAGRDVMFGDRGRDTFVFHASAPGHDVIVDFQDDIDTLVFEGFDSISPFDCAEQRGTSVLFNLGEAGTIFVVNTTVEQLMDDALFLYSTY
ncbi:MAG: calcium-binding protein, partial [Pikeienuella sp.]